MNPSEIRESVVRALEAIAPEMDAAALGGGDDLRDVLDIDSMDFLRFVTDLHARLHVDIPERDYPQIRTLDACVTYLASRLSS